MRAGWKWFTYVRLTKNAELTDCNEVAGGRGRPHMMKREIAESL